MRIVIDMQGAQTESRFRGIGRYSMGLVLAMARNAGKHEIWLVLNSAFPESILDIRHAFKTLIPKDRIRVFEVPQPVSEYINENTWRARVAELIREQFLQQLNPDIVLLTSLFEGFLDDAVTSVGAYTSHQNTAVIFYDLIPYLAPQKYLPTLAHQAHYGRKIESLKNADLLLAISESTRDEGIKHLQRSKNKVVNISSAVDDRFRPVDLSRDQMQKLRQKYGIERKMVMYAPGGFDSRKNFEGIIKAYSLLSRQLRSEHQLVIVSKINNSERDNLLQLAKQASLDENELVLTGYVSDEDLIALYNIATLFVFPSRHEGFGLPVLEAMACGAPVIGSNTTSIPEVIGWKEALFDPHSPKAIAKKIGFALQDETFLKKLRDHGRQQIRKFSWEASAKSAIKAFEATISVSKPTPAHWEAAQEKYQNGYQALLKAIANIIQENNVPNAELKLISQVLALNFEQLEGLVRNVNLPEKLTWRLEGPFDNSYSLALLNRETALALDALGHNVVLHSTEGPGDFEPDPQFLKLNPVIATLHGKAHTVLQQQADIVSRNLYPPRVEDMNCRINMLHHYAWEESGFPPQWTDNFNQYLQGLTCLSTHVQKIMLDNGVTVPMTTSGCGVDHWERIKSDKSYQLNTSGFCFLHVSSCFPRKGADVMLKAYGDAFSKKDDVTLVIKTFANPHNEVHHWLAEAKQTNPNYPDVLIIEDDLTDAQLKSVYEQCHALVGPSRAEGFGLPLAEAMLSGLPVITTGWSGQLDFCTPETAWLVDYTFAPADTHFGLFNSVWAEPQQPHLAKLMREVYELPVQLRAEKPKRGRELLLQKFKWELVAQRLVDSARLFARPRLPNKPKIGWITTWNTKCGIATYSAHLINLMPQKVTLLAANTGEQIAPDNSNVVRCWQAGEADLLDDLRVAIEENLIDTLVLQFNYGFFNFEHFSKFLETQLGQGKNIIIMFHATTDPVHVPDKRLEQLTAVLKKCSRLLVHAPGDLNRLKALGLVDNVAIFPHGVIDWVPATIKISPSVFTVASYGFFLPHKGLFELIAAVKLLVDSGLNIKLKMINAEYPIPESAEMVNQARAKVIKLGMEPYVEIISDFLPDEDSLLHLSAADLIVFPYQETGESSSAAVRYGLASGKPVAVTPLAIFDDVNRAVFKLPGCLPEDLADGIARVIKDLTANNETAIKNQQDAQKWREAHSYAKLSLRLNNMLTALSNQNHKD
jgi:glycosyltransferase involved in cell wall biosynthesis